MSIDVLSKEGTQISTVGPIPPGLAQHFRSVPAPQLPELARLPRPGERDPITGSSRQWLIDHDAELPPAEKFLFRVRRRGRQRGACFVNVQRLLAFFQKSEAADRNNGAKAGKRRSKGKVKK
jgi:hypothetical protein